MLWRIRIGGLGFIVRVRVSSYLLFSLYLMVTMVWGYRHHHQVLSTIVAIYIVIVVPSTSNDSSEILNPQQ